MTNSIRAVGLGFLIFVGLRAQNPETAVFPGAVATDKTLFVAANGVSTTLAAAITGTSDTTISVTSSAAFIVPTVVKIDSEVIAVCSKSTGVLTVCTVASDGFAGRGFSNTTSATHLNGATVSGTIDRAFHNRMAAEVMAIETAVNGKAASNASTTVNGQTCTLGSTCTVADSTKVPTTTTVNGHALSGNVTVTASDVSLGSVTNDAQTKAAIVPNTAPSAGQILAGNAGGTAYAPVSMSGDATMASTGALTLAAALKVRTCEIVIGDPGSSSSALADDNDSPAVCANLTGATMTITEVKCRADSNTGSPTVLPIITGGASSSILSGGTALACGNGVFGSAGTLNGTPTQVDGATIDGNIATAGGTAKMITIRIKRTL